MSRRLMVDDRAQRYVDIYVQARDKYQFLTIAKDEGFAGGEAELAWHIIDHDYLNGRTAE